MKHLHPLSFVLGLLSGILLLVIVVSGTRHFWPVSTMGGYAAGGQNTSRMAQRFGMTQADLQKELDAGKTIQQVAQEHGVSFGGGRNRVGGTSTTQTGTGAAQVSSGSGSQAATAATGAVLQSSQASK